MEVFRPSLRTLLVFSAALHASVVLALNWVVREPVPTRPERPPVIVELSPSVEPPAQPRPRQVARAPAVPREPVLPTPQGPPASAAPPPSSPAPPTPKVESAPAPTPAPPPEPRTHAEARPAPAPDVPPPASPPAVQQAPEVAVAPSLPSLGSESPGQRFSLLSPKLDVPIRPPLSSERGGDSGSAGQNGAPVPLTTRDPRYAEYFVVLACRIEEHMAYPEQAIRDRVGGHLLVEFSLAKDGHVESAQVREPSGHSTLDGASLLAIRLAAPFPPIPAEIGNHLAISAVFHWIFDEKFRRFPPLGLSCPRARS